MACVLTTGRTEPCRDSIGGLKSVFLLDFLEDSFTITGGEATAVNASISSGDVYKYELVADGNNFAQTNAVDPNTNNTTYDQVGTIVLKKQDLATTNQLDIVAKGRPVAVYHYRDGSYRIQGISDGTVVTGDSASGGAKSEFNGYNRTLTSTETSPAPFMDSSTITAFLALVSATVINP